jgi:hypothetical protein
MIILEIPQSGKRGLNVSQAGRFGQISRALGETFHHTVTTLFLLSEGVAKVCVTITGIVEYVQNCRGVCSSLAS